MLVADQSLYSMMLNEYRTILHHKMKTSLSYCDSPLSCVTCCCYKLLENPTIGHVKSKPTRDAIIHLLGVLIKKYNHLLG